jgi:amino acid transporter
MKVLISFLMVLIILSFSFYERLESLRSFTIVGSYLSLIILYFVVSLCLYQLKLNNQLDGNAGTYFLDVYPDPVEYHYGVNFSEVPTFFGIALFAYDINAVITEVR